MVFIGCVEVFNRRLHGKNLSSVAGGDDLPLVQITEEELQVYNDFLDMLDNKATATVLGLQKKG